MCGIFGVLNANINEYLGDIFQAGNKVRPRGPERTKIIYTDEYFLTFHRLSIMNTSPVFDQPFVYNTKLLSGEKEFYYIMCNGEIYNYSTLQNLYLDSKDPYGSVGYLKGKSLRTDNDTAVIFELFKTLGYDFCELNRKLNGEYALAIIKMVEDPVTQVHHLSKVWFSTDTSSVRPMFLVIDEKVNTVAFSSLLTGISWLPYGLLDKKKVKRLDGGEMVEITFKNGEIASEKKSYYKEDLNIIALTKPMSNEEELKVKIVNTLNACVERRLQSDRPIGCLLSGGLDSSLVAAIAAGELATRGQQLRTFSIGMTGGTDLYYARKVAEHINSIHTEVIFTEEEGLSVIEDVIKTCESYDITTIRASVGQYLLARWIRKNTDIKVVLNGDGADEAQMGYIYYYLAPSHIEAHRDSMRLIDEIHLYDGLRVDRNVSRWGLEARVPYLDKHFIGLYKKIAPYLKVPIKPSSESNGRIEKYLLRKAYEEAYKKYPILPTEVLWRAKETFSDALSSREKSWYLTIQEWVEKNVKVIREPNLHNESLGEGNLLNPDHGSIRNLKNPDIINDVGWCPSVSKESQWYREVFEREFGKDVVRVIPHYWLSSWSGSTEPAARSLKVYEVNR